MKRLLSFDVGTKTLAFCDISCNKLSSGESVVNINNWNVNDISIKNKKHDINQVIEKLLSFLETFDVNVYDIILIENQPAFINAVMKSIQMIIFTYFTIKKRENNKNITIQFCSASNKMKTINNIDTKAAENILQDARYISKSDKGYKFNKQLSIELMYYFLKNIIENKDSYLEFFNSYSKNDDLSDCFLQALYYYTNQKSCV